VTSGRYIRPTVLTNAALAGSAIAIVVSAAFALTRYPHLPDLLVVHFMRNGWPNGWQYKTYARVLMPVFVQLALAITLGSIAALLLSRSHGEHDRTAPDVKVAAAAAEAVALIAFIWIAFQAYATFALIAMWQRERAGLYAYNAVELAGIVLTGIVGSRAYVQLGTPTPRPFVPEHWRFGQLYKNADDPALFVPTRNGARWTLNFGRPVAVVLMGIVLVIGIVAPALILGLSLR
jgi:uncharacterized membrane protein